MSMSLRNVVESHPFFKGLNTEQIDTIVSDASEKSYNSGEYLFREGEPANRFFLVQSGRVALEARGPGGTDLLVETINPGDVVGWSWLFQPFTWHLQARCLDTTKVIVLSGGHLLKAAEQNHDFGYELMKRVSQVVIHRLQSARKRLVEQNIASALEG